MRKPLRLVIIPGILLALLVLMQALYLVSFFDHSLFDNLDYAMLTSAGAMAFSTAIDILFIRYITDSESLFEKEKEAELKANLENLDKKYFELMETELAESSDMKQRILQNIVSLKESIEVGQVVEDASIRNIDEEVAQIRKMHFCEEPTADMVLTLKKNLADRESLPMTIRAVVPKDIQIARIDLSSVISNLIDNSVEAAIEVKQKGLRAYVDVAIAQRESFLVIRTENPTLFEGRTDDIDQLRTTKDNSYGMHGYGLKILQNLAARYGGELTVEIEDHKCVFVMMLNCFDEDCGK